MRRRPERNVRHLDFGTPGRRVSSAATQGDRIQPFAVSGGFTRWAFEFGVGVPELAGAQLLCSQYVGKGQTGFVKMLTACPYKPSILHNSQYTELVPGAVVDTNGNNPDSDNGWWGTPMGWEGYVPGEFPAPIWRWHIRILAGDIAKIKAVGNLPPFSLVDPASWFLVPNIPVPASAYDGGLPGMSPSGWGPQRMQVTNWEAGEVHILIPEDSTVALFATWEQSPYDPFYQATDGAGIVDLGRDVYVLGPSFGRLVGYTQPLNRASTAHNAVYGWQS